jgi:hypothetical protein
MVTTAGTHQGTQEWHHCCCLCGEFCGEIWALPCFAFADEMILMRCTLQAFLQDKQDRQILLMFFLEVTCQV